MEREKSMKREEKIKRRRDAGKRVEETETKGKGKGRERKGMERKIEGRTKKRRSVEGED